MAEATDAELFERCKSMAIDAYASAVAAAAEGVTEQGWADGAGLPTVSMLVAMPDLRELGSFKLPDGKTIWVYRARASEAVYAIGWQRRLALQQLGHTYLTAYTIDDEGD